MPVIVRVAPPHRGGGSSTARYIAERELDRERESRETRRIFSDREDNLTHQKAHDFLADGAEWLAKEDLLQIIISLLPEEYERLGNNDLERRAVLIQVTREAIGKLSEEDLDRFEPRWAASLHLNTPLPHLHLLMHKEFTHPITGEKKILQRLPRELLAERGSSIRDEDPARLGKISQRFSEALEEHSKPFGHVQIRDIEGKTLASREVIEANAVPERKPTSEETTVGKWIVAEAHAAHAKSREVSMPLTLREYVQRLDEHNAKLGLKPTAAFLTKEQISELRSYRTSGLYVSFQTTTLDPQVKLERVSREKPERVPNRNEHERQNLRHTHGPDEHESQIPTPKEVAIREQQISDGVRTVVQRAQFPLQDERRSLSSHPKAGFEDDTVAPISTGLNKEKAAPTGSRRSATRPLAEASFKQQKLKAQEELFESRGRVLIQQYLALSINPSQAKEFERAAKSHLEAGQHVDSLLKNYRQMYKEAAPAGAILSGGDKDYLVNNVPRLRHAPGSIRNAFLRDVSAAKTSEQARSYLPKEPRKFQERRPARDKKGGRGR